jgi:lysophospholipase L1-like esterase
MTIRLSRRLSSSLLFAAVLALTGTAFGQAAPATSFKFDFGATKAVAGRTQILPDMVYSKERGYGFEPGAAVTAVHRTAGDLITSDKPFLFSVAVPEGNYQVTVTLGDPEAESKTTVKAEIRRLMVENAQLPKGKTATYTFNVAVRTPQIPGGAVVRLKPRETTSEIRAWDDKLSLEFDDTKIAVSAIDIKPVNDLPVVFVCGDSTICDQPGENNASWGQMLTRFFKPDVVVANHGESGESLRGFLGEKRWDKVLSLMKKGDYMIVQMGHNDEKESGPNVGALTSFKTDLKRFIADTRAKGATPIIVSPMERRSFDDAGKQKLTHGQYPEAFRQVAQEDKVAFVDLTALSAVFYNTLGADKAYLAFAGTGTNRDATHHNNYGAYELAKIVVQGLKDNKSDLAKYIVDDFKGFDPAKPDPVDTFNIPAGPSTFNLRPLGN